MLLRRGLLQRISAHFVKTNLKIKAAVQYVVDDGKFCDLPAVRTVRGKLQEGASQGLLPLHCVIDNITELTTRSGRLLHE
jgi:hypothetical protein